MVLMPTMAQIEGEALGVPGHRSRRIRVDRIDGPVLDLGSSEILILLLRAQPVTRRMAGAAMAQTLHKIAPRFHSADRLESGWSGPSRKYSAFQPARSIRMLKGKESSFAGGAADTALRVIRNA